MVEEYNLAVEKVKEFHTAFQTYWFSERKPHGFDIQDIRLGALIQRLSSCRVRLEKYINGEIASIPELEEPVLEKDNVLTRWSDCVSPNVIIHM